MYAAQVPSDLPSPDDILTPGEVALLFRADPRTVNRWAREGLLPYFRTPGGQKRFRRSEIMAFIESHGAAVRADGGKLPGDPPAEQVGGTPDVPVSPSLPENLPPRVLGGGELSLDSLEFTEQNPPWPSEDTIGES